MTIRSVGGGQAAAFLTDVLSGLAGAPKTLPSRWLYDPRGSELFEAITTLPEYYPSRTETGILRAHARELGALCGEAATILEYGAGAGVKTKILFEALPRPAGYVPIDIAGDFLEATVERFRAAFPGVPVTPIVADFTSPFALPPAVPEEGRVAFFPGSTIGNLTRAEAAAFLRTLRQQVGPAGRAIIGVDLTKDVDLLLAAYDDAAGVTARFNLNLLTRIDRELGGDFVVERFAHRARWNAGEAAIEMHLESTVDQRVTVAGRRFAFRAGETIHTESSRKYTVADFGALATGSGWSVDRVWQDDARWFGVFGLRASETVTPP